MAAVISVCQNYGFGSASFNGEVAKNISNFLPIDNGLASKYDYPVRIPLTGVAYSFETWIRCRCDYAPASYCNNFLAWYDTGLPAEGFNITVNSDIVSDYQQPSDSQSVRGTRVNFSEHNSEETAIPLDGILSDVGDYTSWLVFQLEISSDASLGDYSVDYIIQYDEV
jgi:hypothetical protein